MSGPPEHWEPVSAEEAAEHFAQLEADPLVPDGAVTENGEHYDFWSGGFACLYRGPTGEFYHF